MHSLRVQIFSFIAAILLILLLLLNTYPMTSSRDMVFEEKHSAMSSQATVIASSLSGLDRLTKESVAEVLRILDIGGYARTVVTDADGLVLYDDGGTVDEDTDIEELLLALTGKCVFRSLFTGEAFASSFAMPVYGQGAAMGALYIYEYDAERAEIIVSIQSRIRTISLAICSGALLVTGLFTTLLLRRMRELVRSIKIVASGDYSHRLVTRGRDEITDLGEEFNLLTERLDTTEKQRRRFVSDASHELKTPLAGIRLLTDSILQTEDMNADTTREFVEDIGREAQRLSRITEDLLRLTRLDSGIQDAAYPVSVSRVLERVVRMLGVVAREKEVTLTYETDEDAVVRATEDDIHQILYNLMENGIKYSGSMGFVHTTLKTVGDTVVISVEDNGIGIPDEDMEHVFERFYRVDKNRSRAVGGTGLGLSIVSDTVRRRGGSIRAQHRQSGSGTVFIVELPLARREESDE